MKVTQLNERTVAIDDRTRLLIHKNHTDYFSIETTDYEDNAVFVIPQYEEEVYKVFKRLLNDIFTHYCQTSYNKMGRIDPLDRSILVRSDTFDPHQLAIEEDEEKGAIIITILKNQNNTHRNNRVILDRDGALWIGYFEIFDTFLENLKELGSRSTGDNSRGRKTIFFKRKRVSKH